jgi:hypothetical protein
MKKWSTSLAIAVMALAFALPAAAQGYGQYQRVLGERAEAGASLAAGLERARARSEVEAALTARGEALNDRAAVNRPLAERPADGFDWRAAEGGAGVTLALVVGAFGIVYAVRRTRQTPGRRAPGAQARVRA